MFTLASKPVARNLDLGTPWSPSDIPSLPAVSTPSPVSTSDLGSAWSSSDIPSGPFDNDHGVLVSSRDPTSAPESPIFVLSSESKTSTALSSIQPPVLVPSNLVWDKSSRQYVDSASHYYYETKQPSAFNNFGPSETTPSGPAVTPSSKLDPLALMEALSESIPSVSPEDAVVKEKAAGPMHTITETSDGRKMLTVLDTGYACLRRSSECDLWMWAIY